MVQVVSETSKAMPALPAGATIPVGLSLNESYSSALRQRLLIDEACAIAGIGRTKIFEAISASELVARKYCKRTLILRADLQDFLTSLPTMQPDG